MSSPQRLIFTSCAWIEKGEDELAAKVLTNYGSAVSGREAEGRRRAAKGVGELAELYALVVPDHVPTLVRSISRQLMRESDARMQSHWERPWCE